MLSARVTLEIEKTINVAKKMILRYVVVEIVVIEKRVLTVILASHHGQLPQSPRSCKFNSLNAFSQEFFNKIPPITDRITFHRAGSKADLYETATR